MLEKINFKVIKATSEDPGYSSCELEKHGPTIHGWRSAKLTSTSYPQEIVIQLESRCRIGHLQLLAHQYLIPEKIDIYFGETIEEIGKNERVELDNVHFILLGSTNLSTNQGSGFKARELKSISVDCFASFLKIVICANHRNKYNRHSQVALVAINILGEKLDEDEGDFISSSSSTITFEETNEKGLFSQWDDLSFTMYVDVSVQQTIKIMDQKKQEAVLDERFDYASKLKSTMEQLRKSGEVLAKYQLEKQIAASREDFQRAKEKKIQMETYKETLYKSLRITLLLEPNGRLNENDEPGKISELKAGMTRSITELSICAPSMHSAASTPESTTSDRFSRRTTPDGDKKESGYLSNDEPKFPPLFVKKRRSFKSSSTTSVDRDKSVCRNEPKAPSSHLTTLPQHLINFQRPSNLSERAKRYAALPISVFGEFLVEKIFSRNFAVKEDGLRCLQKFLADYKKSDRPSTLARMQLNQGNDPPPKVFRAATLLLQRTIKDTIFSVFDATIHTLIYLMDDFAKKHRLPGSEISQGLERLLPELFSKSGDTALGKNKVATDCILRLQSCQHIRCLHVISSHLTKPFDTPVLPRLAQSKTEMVEEILNNYGISSEKNCGMTARDYVEFAVSALNQPSESVRRPAERLIITLYERFPKLVRQNLPLEEAISLKNIQLRQLFQQFEKIDKDRKGPDGPNINVILKDSVGSKSNNPMTSSVYVPKM